MSLGANLDARVPVPEGLAWWKAVSGGAEWLRALPQLVEACVQDWELTLGAPFEPGSMCAVLKVSFPDVESEHEADALAFWAGSGAARLFRS